MKVPTLVPDIHKLEAAFNITSTAFASSPFGATLVGALLTLPMETRAAGSTGRPRSATGVADFFDCYRSLGPSPRRATPSWVIWAGMGGPDRAVTATHIREFDPVRGRDAAGQACPTWTCYGSRRNCSVCGPLGSHRVA